MAKFKLTVTKDGEKHEHSFDAKDKASADEYGANLARFGGFDPDAEDTTIKVAKGS